MNEKNATRLIAFSEADHAESLTELFDSIKGSFAVYMDEMVHAHPDNPIGPKQAGREDALQTPPKPLSGEMEPADENYVAQLYSAARSFFRQYIERCRSRFGAVKSRIDALMATEPWSQERWDQAQRDLTKANAAHDTTKDAFQEYEASNKEKVGNALLNPKRPLPLIFVAWVFFVAIFEFVWVWFFMSEQLGAGAIYISAVAATLVVLIAGLCAFAQSNRALDLPTRWRLLGSVGVAFSILLFLFGIGMLSGWRADSTNEGIEVVLGGYRSLTKMDVFVTAVINLAGFVFLTREFKRFFWPNPLHYYAQHLAKIKASEVDILKQRNRLNGLLTEARDEVLTKKREINDELRRLDRFRKEVARNILSASSSLEELVAAYQGEYSGQNITYRTKRAYPAPVWLDKCAFKIFDDGGSTEIRDIQAEFEADYEEYRNRCNDHLDRLDVALQEITAASIQDEGARST